jgi:hypothetical protein
VHRRGGGSIVIAAAAGAWGAYLDERWAAAERATVVRPPYAHPMLWLIGALVWLAFIAVVVWLGGHAARRRGRR